MAWLLGLPPLTAKVAVAAAALPSGVNSYLIAVQFGTGQALASNQMTIATACAVVTTAFWLIDRAGGVRLSDCRRRFGAVPQSLAIDRLACRRGV